MNLDDPRESNWTLVATTCVEAGINLSFRTGLREQAGLVNLLQASGRINREGKLPVANIWSITLQRDALLTRNPQFDDGAAVLNNLFDRYGTVTADFCPEALRLEIRDYKRQDYLNSSLIKAEEAADFPEVEKLFRVIDSDSVLVLADENLGRRFDNGESLSWRDLQSGCVSLHRGHADKLNLPELTGYPGVYRWVLAYDGFLGYMRGVLDLAAFDRMGGGCV
jgi:CRISPR-associated endonuclease/helicase Cas3